MKTYLLDTNFFIDAHRTTYPFDVFPSYWGKIQALAEAGSIFSVDKVFDEINRHTDALTAWVNAGLPNGFFRSSGDVVPQYADVVRWANGKSTHYFPTALATFMQAEEADAWLVAHGIQSGCTIVTHEISNPDMKRSIKIPEPCNHFGIQFIKPVEMLRELGVTI